MSNTLEMWAIPSSKIVGVKIVKKLLIKGLPRVTTTDIPVLFFKVWEHITMSFTKYLANSFGASFDILAGISEVKSLRG